MFTMLSVNDIESIHTDADTEVYNIKVMFFFFLLSLSFKEASDWKKKKLNLYFIEKIHLEIHLSLILMYRNKKNYSRLDGSGLGGVIILQSPWKKKMNPIFFFFL